MFERSVGERGPNKTRKIRILVRSKEYVTQGVTIPNNIANLPLFSGANLCLYTSGTKIILEPIQFIDKEEKKLIRGFDEIEKREPW
jgi:hypothetical protein